MEREINEEKIKNEETQKEAHVHVGFFKGAYIGALVGAYKGAFMEREANGEGDFQVSSV